MVTESHRVAEAHMGYGDAAASHGDQERAQEHYLRAARAEVEAFDLTPSEKPRTRGALAVSAVALYRKAGDLTTAARQAHRALSLEGVPSDAQRELEMLLDEMRTQELALEVMLPGSYQWVLRGGRVGPGVARMATFAQKVEQIQRYAWRVFEMLAGRVARTVEPVPEDVRGSVDLLVGQPVAGSFIFTVGLAERQLRMHDILDMQPAPEAVADAFGAVLTASLDADPQVLDTVVPDPAYRDVFLRVVRNIAPDGRDVGEIEVRRIGVVGPPAILRPEIRATIGKRIARRRRGAATIAPEEVLRDVLRVIDLNRGHIALGPRDREVKCRVPNDLPIVDMVAGLEDRPVRVRGHRQGAAFIVHDIEADFGDPTEPE